MRFLRIDTPALWRLTAHSAVLVLTLGVFLMTRYARGATANSTTTAPENPSLLQQGVSGASWLLPAPLTTAPAMELSVPTSGPVDDRGFVSPGVIAEADQSLLPWDEPHRYVVKDGDTIIGIAGQFGIKPETVLAANPDLRTNPHSLRVGTDLTILPMDGVLHRVEQGDTLDSIAKKYLVRVEDILAYTPNGLGGSGGPGVGTQTELVAGSEIVVPGGSMEIKIPSYLEVMRGSSDSTTYNPAKTYTPSGAMPLPGTGNFYVAAYGRITRGFSGQHAAVDIANRTGTPIYAIDSGAVTLAGWWSWAGNAVIIDHGNGYTSLYAHMSRISVSAGETIQRGQIVGAIGCTRGRGGWCTGPHLHLEVEYNGRRVNPCGLGACP